MKLVVYIQGDAIKHFPSSAEMERQCVGLSAVRTGPAMVRWTLTGPAAVLDEYAGIARDQGLAYLVEAGHE